MRKRSYSLLISVVVATLYLLYIVVYFTGILEEGETGSGLATVIVLPHMILLGIGVIFGWILYICRLSWAALVAAILYCVSGLLFVIYIIFLVVPIVFGFIGYVNQKKLNVQNRQ